MNIKDLHYWSTGGGYNMCRATVQGITFFKSNRTYHEVELPKNTAKIQKDPAKKDGRIASNQARTGTNLRRNGQCVRTGEIRRRIHAWCGAIGGVKRIRFFTITFPEGTKDEDGKKALNIWLTRLRLADPKINYFWTAERQQNETIHFHLLLDRHMSIQMVNGWMKTTLINMGEKIPWSNPDHKAIYGGVNVKQKIYSGHGVEKYLIKYLTKSSFSGIGQPWHASRELGKLAVRVRKPSSEMLVILQNSYIQARRKFGTVRLFFQDGILYVPFPDNYNQEINDSLAYYNGWQKGGYSKHSPYNFPAIVAAQPLEHPLPSVAITDTAKSQPPQALNLLSIFPPVYRTWK